MSTNFAPKIGIFRPLSVSKGVSLPSTAKERNIHDFWREVSLRGSAAATIFAPEVEIVCPCLSRKGVSLPSTVKERNIHDFWREFSLRGSFLASLCILTVGHGSRAIRESPLRDWWDAGMLVADRVDGGITSRLGGDPVLHRLLRAFCWFLTCLAEYSIIQTKEVAR